MRDQQNPKRIAMRDDLPSIASTNDGRRPRMVTLRAVLLALFIMPFSSLWQVNMEVIRYSGHPSTISLFFNVVFIFAVLIGLNTLVRKVRPSWAFDPGELLTIYIMLGLSTAMDGHDMIEVLTPILTHVRYFATPREQMAYGDRSLCAQMAFRNRSKSNTRFLHRQLLHICIPQLACMACAGLVLGRIPFHLVPDHALHQHPFKETVDGK